MKKLFFELCLISITISILMLTGGCGQETADIDEENSADADRIFHYSVLKALDNGVLESNMTVGELQKQGGHGLGTFNTLDGELIAVDGVIYRVKRDGRVFIPEDGTQTPYAVVSDYHEEKAFQMEGGIDYPSLAAYVEERLPSLNLFYAIRIAGTFEYIKCGGADKQAKPYDKSISEMLEGRPLYEAESISGTLVGFWCPPYIGDINTDGFHLHFLAEDLSMAGHLLEFRAGKLDIGYDTKHEYTFVLPETEDFMKATFRDEEVNY